MQSHRKLFSHVLSRMHEREGGCLLNFESMEDPRVLIAPYGHLTLIVNVQKTDKFKGQMIYPKQVRTFMWNLRSSRWFDRKDSFVWSAYEDGFSYLGVGAIVDVRVSKVIVEKWPCTYGDLRNASSICYS